MSPQRGRSVRPSPSGSVVDLRVGIATLFGVGRFPIAPGTAGSAVTLPLAAGLAWLSPWALAPAAVAVTLVGIWAANAAEHRFGVKDPSPVVIDEVAGQMIALAFVPLTAAWFLAGFFLFRVMDVVKPFPARRLERLKGGAGIVLDDVAAGIYANLVLQAVRQLAAWRTAL